MKNFFSFLLVILLMSFLSGCNSSDFDLSKEVACGDITLNIPSNFTTNSETDSSWFFTNSDSEPDTMAIAVQNYGYSDSTGKAERIEYFEYVQENYNYVYELVSEATEENDEGEFYTYDAIWTDGSEFYLKEICISNGTTHTHIRVTGYSENKEKISTLLDEIYKTVDVN